MTDDRPVVAAFDVDGTITRRDCVVPFVRRVSSFPRTVGRMLAGPRTLAPALARLDRDRMKTAFSAAAFAGLDEAEVRAEGSVFARHVHDTGLRADTVESLRRHQADGHTTVFVSASYEVYLDPLGELLGMDGVIGTRLASVDGVLTGGLVGDNCRGPEKVRRLHEWLDQPERGLGGRDAVRVVAYGDSSGDRELLADADEGHLVSS